MDKRGKHPFLFWLLFAAVFISIAESQTCGGLLRSPSSFTSPGYPAHYKSGQECSKQNYGNWRCINIDFCVSFCNWTLVTDDYKNIQLSFDEFYFPMEQWCCPSHVEVWENSTRLVGLCDIIKHEPVISTGNTLFIKMAATRTTDGVYFKASWKTECQHTILESNNGSVSSPKYPKSLGEVGECRWTISVEPRHVIEFTFDTIALGVGAWPPAACSGDGPPALVTLYDSYTTADTSLLKRYCGRSTNVKVSTSTNHLTIKLESKKEDWGNFPINGFNASYKSKENDGSSKEQPKFFEYSKLTADSSLSANVEESECIPLGKNPADAFYGMPVGDGYPGQAKVYADGRILFFQDERCTSTDTGYLDVYHAEIRSSNFGSQIGVDYKMYTRDLCESNCDKADEEIFKYTGVVFETKLLLLATWTRVSHESPDYTGEATFQTAVISDGITTYALNYYKKGSMNWKSTVTPEVKIGYGFLSKGTITHYGIRYSDLEEALKLDEIPGNTDYQGVWLFKLGTPKNITPESQCDEWYDRNKKLDLMKGYSGLPECPCQQELIELHTDWVFSSKDSERANQVCFRLSKARSRDFFPYSKLCCYCYALFGTFTDSGPYAGSALAFNPSYESLVKDYEREDKGAHQLCCVQSNSATHCDKFYQLRPQTQCQYIPQTRFSWMCCEPYITTFDEHGYAFNGWGEYIMVTLTTPGVTFTLQGRTDRPETENGYGNGTVFTAFGARDNLISVFVGLDAVDKSFLIVYADGTDYSLQVRNDPDFLVDTEDFKLSRNNNTLAVSFPSGITIAVSLRVNSLGVSASLPLTFRNQTRGLLGNFNGNKDDDFILPDGSVLPSGLTERQIFHEFGKKWRVTEANSVMRYGLREGPANYSHPDFTPVFLDEQPSSVKQDAERVCGPSSLACITDYVATGSAVIALDSKQFMEEAHRINEIAKNAVPQLDGPSELHLTSGVTVNFTLQGHDLDLNEVLTYHAVDDGNGAIQVHPTTGEVTFTPATSNPTVLRFYVVDSHGVQSPVMDVRTVVCAGCSGHGYCNFTRYSPNEKSSYSVQYAACVCDPAWDGPNCEHDKDSCADYPCMQQQTCTDLTPEQQGNSGIGYDCGPCPAGFTKVQNSAKCSDIDECADNSTNECDMNCYNKIGSYGCSCKPGYRLDKNGHMCLDIDECRERNDNCQHICINTVGSYRCQCEEGYVSDNSGVTCTQNNATASLCTNAGCSHGCRSVVDTVTGNRIPDCFCLSGYDLDPTDNKTCRDHDECQDNVCSHQCFNFEGGYICYCYNGYKLSDDKITCELCPPLHYGPNCELTCTCSGRFKDCDPISGCICEDGWTGNLCQYDVDECSENKTICKRDQLCVNTKGSYTCGCLDGYKKDADGYCRDIDECAEGYLINTCGPLKRCTNLPGSFYCTCNVGYQSLNGACTDVDECVGGNHDCEQVCVNVMGTYNCDCYYGYRLNTDRVSCTRVSDVCAEMKGLNCAHGCTLSDGNDQAVCFCRKGYQLSADRQTCLDIDECRDGSSGCSHTCTNTDGGCLCSCPLGMKLDNDMKTCLDCPDGTYGSDCAKICNCGVGFDHCDVETGCVCKAGWQVREERCEDIDECATPGAQQDCQSKNGQCFNYPGGYRCQCEDGYQPNDNRLCQDIDECSLTTNLCDHQCQNLPGSYRCSCYKGFRLDSRTGLCRDTDECKLSVLNNCTQRCINMIGSYKCACDQAGYVLDSNGVSCSATVTCQRTDCPVENGGCSKEQCFCNSGYDLTGNMCQRKDVDWCEADWCEHNCQETEDGNYFKCSCRPGYFLQKDNLTCNACPQGRYGHECSNICVCNKTNAISCNTVDGTCRCKAGWEGTTCSDDTDECAATRGVVCPDNSYCLNSAGGYSCPCKEGYLKRSSGSCVASCTGGGDCGENAASCDSVTGACKCKAGWEGPRCEREINECMTGQHDCRGDHSICVSRNGGYECLCEEGYNMVGSRGCVGLLKVRIKFTFNDISVTSIEISDRNSQSYSFWANSTSKVIASRLLPSVKGFRFVTILMLRVGSLIVEADIVVDVTSHPDSTQTLSLALLDMAGDSVTVSGQKSTVSVFISDDEVTSSWTACQVYEAIQPCPGNEECHMEKELPECRTVERGTPDIILAIVLGITIPLIIVTIIIVTVVCIVKKKNKAVPRIDLYTKDFDTKSASSSDVFTVQTSQPVSNSNTPLQTAFDPGQSGTRPNTAVENPYAKPTSLTAQPTEHNYAKLSPMFGGSPTGLGNTRLFTQPLYKDDLTYNTINDPGGPGSARPPSARSYASVGGWTIGLDENSQEDGANYTTGQGRRDSSRQEQ